jgi:hypothetical protein
MNQMDEYPRARFVLQCGHRAPFAHRYECGDRLLIFLHSRRDHMKAYGKTRTYYMRMPDIALVGISLVALAGARCDAASKMPSDYDTDMTTHASAYCQSHFGGVGIPKTGVWPNRYILELVFDRRSDNRQFINDVFHITDAEFTRSNASKTDDTKTVGCLRDYKDISPAATTKSGSDDSAASAEWTEAAKGGCPSDCTGDGRLLMTDALKKKLENLKRNPIYGDDVDPDPLRHLEPGVKWGIFSAYPSKDEDLNKVMVWQITVRDRRQANVVVRHVDIYCYDNADNCDGYLGHLLIGTVPYTP